MTDLLPVIPRRGAAVSASQVADIERHLAGVLDAIDDITILEEWRARARALEHYLKGKELKSPMAGAQRRCEARIGELLGPAPGQGTRTDLTSPRAEKLIGRDQDIADFRVLAHAFNGCALTDDEWRKSRRALLVVMRKRLGMRPKTPPLPDGTFACITADPPWRLDTGENTWGASGEVGGHDDLEYDQMSVEAIKQLAVPEIAAPDCHLYLWTTNRYIEAAYEVARAWGFKTPGTMLVWAKKPRGVGLGDAYRMTTEYVLFCRRGSLPTLDTVPTTWFAWPRGRHSAKPTAFYDMVETVTPGPHLEMFAREQRPGWTTWGDEVTP